MEIPYKSKGKKWLGKVDYFMYFESRNYLTDLSILGEYNLQIV